MKISTLRQSNLINKLWFSFKMRDSSNSPIVAMLYLFYRIIEPIIDPIRTFLGLYGYLWFIRDIIIYKRKAPKEKLLSLNLYPKLDERLPFTHVNPHYFFQQIWAFENVLKKRPRKHIDIASSFELSGYISTITKAVFLDLRPIDTKLDKLEVIKGDILDLPFRNGSVESLSCLHTIEHIGLGRYGDTIDPRGTIKACNELKRVLAKNGYLYLSVPIGEYRLCFNAHRIHTPEMVIQYCKDLVLVEFSVVDDEGKLHKNVNYKDYSSLRYGCGMFTLTKR